VKREPERSQIVPARFVGCVLAMGVAVYYFVRLLGRFIPGPIDPADWPRVLQDLCSIVVFANLAAVVGARVVLGYVSPRLITWQIPVVGAFFTVALLGMFTARPGHWLVAVFQSGGCLVALAFFCRRLEKRGSK
jgi:hypothetical protein